MGSSHFENSAVEVGSLLRGAKVTKVFRPDRWTLGLGLGLRGTLGFCWHPTSAAVGICGWRWPKKAMPDVLKACLEGARIEGASALVGEAVLLVLIGGPTAHKLVFECLGRSSNILLLGGDDIILWSGRTLGGELRSGREGDRWVAPNPIGFRPSVPDPFTDGSEKLRRGLLDRAKAELLRALSAREEKLRRRIHAVAGDRAEGGDWAGLEGVASSLLATGNLTSRGAASKICVDYSKDPPEEVEVRLDPALTLKQNIEAIFNRARKGRRRLARTSQLLSELEGELAAMSLRKAELETAENLEAFYPHEVIPVRGGRVAKADKLPKGIRKVPLPSGFTGYAGKSAAGNDLVSFRIGSGGDFWFHVQDYPGSHLVVKNPSRLIQLPPAVETAAALVAAENSRAPAGNRIGVIVAQCKNLRRIRGSQGQVALSGGRTVFVDLPPR